VKTIHPWCVFALSAALVILPAALSATADTQVSLRQAVEDLEAGRLEAAEQKLNLVLGQAPDSPGAHFYLGVVRFRMRRFGEARQALLQAAKLAPTQARVWKALGTVYAAESDFVMAEEPFRKACELDPKEEDACFYLARNYYAMNRFEAAVAAFEKALAVDNKPWRVHDGKGLALEGLGRHPEAERHFRRAVKLHAGQARPDENPRIDLGAFLYKQGRAAEALVELQRSVRDSPDSARARFELGRVLFHKDRLKEAESHLAKAVQLQPAHWAAHLLLGKTYYRLGRDDLGARHIEQGQAGLQSQPVPK